MATRNGVLSSKPLLIPVARARLVGTREHFWAALTLLCATLATGCSRGAESLKGPGGEISGGATSLNRIQSANHALNSSPAYALSGDDVSALKNEGLLEPGDEAELSALTEK